MTPKHGIIKILLNFCLGVECLKVNIEWSVYAILQFFQWSLRYYSALVHYGRKKYLYFLHPLSGSLNCLYFLPSNYDLISVKWNVAINDFYTEFNTGIVIHLIGLFKKRFLHSDSPRTMIKSTKPSLDVYLVVFKTRNQSAISYLMLKAKNTAKNNF